MNWKKHLIKYFGLMLLRYPMSVIAVVLFSTKDKQHLTRWKWLETIDNSLAGDEGWQSEHLLGSNPLSLVNRVRWLMRNGGNRYNYEVIGVPDDTPWRESITQGYGLFKRPDGAWLNRIKVPLIKGRFLQMLFGWNIFGPQHGLCKYVCTIRIKTKE